jgi:cytochrome c-type biogenesis protein CcmH/NrfG
MVRRMFLLLLVPAILFAAPKQSVVLITLDTTRADHLGCYGYAAAKTPNLDALARRSLFFQTAVCQAPLTLVSHTSLMTGLYPYHHGIRDNAGIVDSKLTTLAEILRQDGYHTYAFVGGFPLDHRFGLSQGFDVYNDTFPREKNRSLDFRSERNAEEVVKAVLSAKLRSPYFVWVHFYDPHAPYLHGGYDGEIAYVDKQIGRLMARFSKDGPIVAVAGDHGESLGEHGEWTHRIFVYDSTMKVPFFVYRPGAAPQKISKQARLIDFMPTLLSFIKLPSPEGIDGAVLPKSAGAPAVMESLFPQLELGWSPVTAIRTDQWKYIQLPKPELYSLTVDPKETKNIIAINPQTANTLRTQLPQSAIRNPQSAISPEMREQLASLGYTSGKQDRKTDPTIDPKDRIGIWNQIELAVDLETSKPEESLKTLQQAQKADPENPMLLSFLAQKYAEANQLTEAEAILKQTLARDPENALALYRLAHVLLKSGKAADARKTAEALREKEPEDPDALILLARTEIQLGSLKDAVSHLESALSIDPGDLDLRNDLGNLYLQIDRTDEAQSQFQKVLKSDPNNLQALNGLATALYNEHDLIRSAAFLKQALILSPGDPQSKMNLALVYATEGRRTEAIRLYHEVQQSPSTPPQWKAEAASRLKELQ